MGPVLLVVPYLAVTVAILQTWAAVPPQLLDLWGMGGACPALHMLDLWDGTPGIRLRSWGEWTYPEPAAGFQQAFQECRLNAASLALCRLAHPFSLLVLYMLTVTALSTRSLPCLSCLRKVNGHTVWSIHGKE